MKHLQNIQGFLISESDIDSMITGFEELGINNPKKLGFIEYNEKDDDHNNSDSLFIAEGYSVLEMVKSFLEILNLDEDDIEEILSQISEEDFDPSVVEDALYEQFSHTKWYSIDNFWIINHPKPGSSGLKLDPELGLNSIEQFLEANQKIKNEFGFGMSDLIKFPNII
jgi:hypothetical protein